MVIIFGLGFTGSRLARRLLRRGIRVWAPVRGIERFADLAEARLSEYPDVTGLPSGACVVITIPPLPEAANTQLHEAILRVAPRRVVYISSTGVYGDKSEIDADSQAAPCDDRGRARLNEEQWIAAGSWTSLILRSAAIYGPGRGVHAALRQGKLPRGIGSGVTSRIHVDDLAAIAEGGIFTDVQGAWPVADDAPCSTDEIVRWCRENLHLETPEMPVYMTTPGRRVDGRKIRELLRVSLKYPDWRSGILASFQEEQIAGVKPSEPRESAR